MISPGAAFADPQGNAERLRPLVSVITPFFNAESFLADAIESVLAQTYRNWELLLVDDGSTDGSTGTAKRYISRFPDRLRYLQHADRSNRGASPSRNLAISQARGEFIAFLDGDDIWLPSKLYEQLSIFEHFPNVDLVAGATRYWSNSSDDDKIVLSGHVQEQVIQPPEAALNTYPLGHAASPCPSDLLVRTSTAVKLGGFDEQFVEDKQLYEDQVFLMKVYLNAPIYFSSKVWLKYRLHPGSCSEKTKRRGNYHEIRQFFLGWLDDYLQTYGELDPRVHAALSQARQAYCLEPKQV